jgi:nitrogen fixation protein NifU and related proteins
VTTELDELYQELILDHYRRPHNHRRLENPDRMAEGYNPLCGDRVTVFLKLDGDRVREITFDGGGCAISTASASIMTDTLKGKTLSEAKELFRRFHDLVTGGSGEEQVGAGLGKLDVFAGVCRYPVRVKCATLAWHTFVAAMDNAKSAVSTE